MRVCVCVGINFFAQLSYQQPTKLLDTDNLHRNIYISPKWNEFNLDRLKLQGYRAVLNGDDEII